MDDSSLQEQLKNKLFKGLKPTSTKLTKPDGSVILLENQGSDVVQENNAKTKKTISGYGFVVDTKPDLTIGRVRPWLFIASQDVPNDVQIISQNKISCILSLLPGFELHSTVRPIIKSHLTLNVFDETNFSLDSPVISEALNFIHECKLLGKSILVHCNAGISRAPSIVMLFLMKYEQVSFEDAFEQIKSARPQIKPNEGFLQQLKVIVTQEKA